MDTEKIGSRLELRGVRTYQRLSRETTACVAKLYLDGKLVGSVENDGGGGPNLVHGDNARCTEAEKYAASLPPFDGLPMDLDLWISLEVGRQDDEKRIARLNKSNVVYRRDGETWTMKIPNGRTRAEVEAHVLAKHPGAEIIKAVCA